MVALASTSEARTFEKPVYRRKNLRLRLIQVETRPQTEVALGVASSTSTNRFRLTNLNRWYDAKVGRWISEDPIGFAAGDSNIYRYVGNSPTNLVDPTGLIGKVAYSDLESKVQAGLDDARAGKGQKEKNYDNKRGEELPGDGPFLEYQCRGPDDEDDDGKRLIHDLKSDKWYYTEDVHAGPDDKGTEAEFDEVTDVPDPS